jgi:hypothetical protein
MLSILDISVVYNCKSQSRDIFNNGKRYSMRKIDFIPVKCRVRARDVINSENLKYPLVFPFKLETNKVSYPTPRL